MNNNRSLAALGAALVLACGVVAWEWYTHVAGGAAAPPPVQAVTAAPSPPSTTPATTVASATASHATTAPAKTAAATPAPSPTTGPVTYVPVEPTSSPAPQATAKPAAAPLEPGSTPSPREMPMEAATIAPAHVAPQVIREPADAPPRILAMSISTPVAHGGETVSGTVETSSNVAAVVARIGGYASPMQKVGVGKFQMSYVVPHLPFFLHRTWMIQVIARNTRGDTVSSAIPITIR